MEQLFIRLSSQPQEPLHWLIWSPAQAELIASGTLKDLSEIGALTDHARSREVVCFAPGTDVLLTSVQLPKSALRMLAQVIPNSLEDELAQDISELHFAWPPVKKSADSVAVPVAVVAHEAMQQWLQALDDADINCDEIYPDVFMLPVAEEGAAPGAEQGPDQGPDQGLHPSLALTLGDTVVVRTGAYSGFSTDASLLDVMAQDLNLQRVEETDIEMPLSIVAQAYNSYAQPARINLRQHQYRSQRKKRKGQSSAASFKPAAIAAGILFAVAYATQVFEYVQLGQQSEQLEQAIVDTYKEAFPNEKRIVNVRAQLNQHMDSLGLEGSEKASMLALMSELESAFKANRDVRLQLLRYEADTLKMQVKANSFASLENFRKVANQSGSITVEQGPVNNQAGAVSGALTVKKDS
ncbi:type II secretion system protein GspL [Pseudidiomarina woesei]|uniref:Type II secretion system protein L n=1 Tax=Pseudidiomarina woesei TaxID=1381080 RepID=A0A0K6H6M3_9GAMM|nr:type II secretion system protein GspL [Pseudidiomarina woesei]CUA86494.1 type II secretion system protein L [Pseudidiomarina woesei]